MSGGKRGGHPNHPTVEPDDTLTTVLRDYSRLTGPLCEPPADRPYTVEFRSLTAAHGRWALFRAIVIGLLGVGFDVLFVLWLLHPSHLPWVKDPTSVKFVDVFLIVSISVVEVLRLLNLISLSLASVLVRDPVPVRPAPGMRVAFVTTIVPDKEPLDMVRRTLAAAKRITYQGVLDVWLLDEGNDPAVRAVCAQLGVRHFSRKNRPEYNTSRGEFRAKTKHGNYNAWLDAHGHDYAVLLGVDPDHAPLPNYAERMLGYFRDPDVAFVASPQCYANYDNFVTKGAESQQFPFHSLIQRAGNTYTTAMLVGTNHATRIDALDCVGGFRDSITEDMATGFAIHTRRNPQTGVRWKSVYTPDLVAVGEGPSCWSDYFNQQLRWSRGTMEVIKRDLWRRLHRMSPGRLLHYALLTTFYPAMAVAWVLGTINAVLCLVMGAVGLHVSPAVWLALYADATAFQLWIFIRNRRYNVSPNEVEDSPGLVGILMSLLASPVYASSLVRSLLFLPTKFVVTPKSSAASQDHPSVFRRHLQWAVLLAGALVLAFVLGHLSLEVVAWPAAALLICLTPMAIWLVARRRARRPLERAERPAVPSPAPNTDAGAVPRAEALERIEAVS